MVRRVLEGVPVYDNGKQTVPAASAAGFFRGTSSEYQVALRCHYGASGIPRALDKAAEGDLKCKHLGYFNDGDEDDLDVGGAKRLELCSI